MFAQVIASSATTEKALSMPRPGILRGVQIVVSQINASADLSTAWVAQTQLGTGFGDYSPVLAFLQVLSAIAGAAYFLQNANSIYVPQNFSVAAGQILYLGVTDSGASTTVSFILHLE